MKGFIEVHELEVDDRSLGIHCVKLIPINRIAEVYEFEGRVYVVHDGDSEESNMIYDCVAESYEEVKEMIEEAQGDKPAFDTDKLMKIVRNTCNRLSPKKREILGYILEGESFEQIGKHYDVTFERIRQISDAIGRDFSKYFMAELIGG